MKKLIVMSALFLAAASTQAVVYWEGEYIPGGSSDYANTNSWDVDGAYDIPYGYPTSKDEYGVIASYGQPSTAASMPIISSVIDDAPQTLRVSTGGTDGTLTLVAGGSITLTALEVGTNDGGNGVLNITGGIMVVTNGLSLGTDIAGGSGEINLTGGSFNVNSMNVGDNGIINLSTNASFTLPGDMTGLGYVDYFSSIEGLAGVRESYDSDTDLTTIYPSDEGATAPGPAWQDPVTVSDAIVVKEYSDTLAGKAIDEHGDPITFAKVDGPDWLTVSSGGALSGVPPADALGTTNSCIFSVTDGSEAPAETTLTILVIKDPDGEQISICFNFDAAFPFEGDTLIGPLNSDSTYWNSSHVLNAPYKSGTLASGLVDSSGQLTTAGISYSASAVNFVKGQTAQDRDKLQRGFLDDEFSGGLTITVTDIPYASYTVYGLIGGDPTGSNDPDYLLWEKPMKSLDFQVNGSWVYGDTSAGPAADVYTTLHASRVGQPAGLGAEWVEIVQGSVTGMYWTTEASGSTLTIQGQAGTDTLTRGALSGIIIKEHIPAGPAQDLVINSSVDGVVLSWTGEAGMPYGVDTNINLVVPNNWGRWETGLKNPAGGVISVTNAVGLDETFYRVISE